MKENSMTCSLERSKKWKWKNSTETRRMRVRATSITGGTLNRAPEDGLQDVKKLTSWTASNSSFLSKQAIDEPGMTVRRRSQDRGKAIHETGRRERPWTCSDHPLLLKKILPFSQFCWLKRICQKLIILTGTWMKWQMTQQFLTKRIQKNLS